MPQSDIALDTDAEFFRKPNYSRRKQAHLLAGAKIESAVDLVGAVRRHIEDRVVLEIWPARFDGFRPGGFGSGGIGVGGWVESQISLLSMLPISDRQPMRLRRLA